MDITIERTKLLNVLEDNKLAHITDYKDATDSYLKLVEENLANCLDEFRTTQILNIAPVTTLRKPVNYINEYERAIMMLTMSSESTITLTENEFAQYVMDEWHWKSSFELTNNAYGVSSKGRY